MMIRGIRWVKPRKVTTKHYLSAPRHQRTRSKKLDYTAVTLLNNQRVGNVKQSCEYDSHANPVDCQLIIVDEGVNPRRRTGLHHQKYDRLLLMLLCGRLQESLTPVFCALPDTDAGIYTCEWHYDIDH
ncbi:lipoprotein [Escherichia coli]|uniref:Lipoprotein n=1 Tax=Escherichia coli TaxID=562 RepID=A0A2X3LW49_ECOLX|nr:lipoprotein [Escherichia coli]